MPLVSPRQPCTQWNNKHLRTLAIRTEVLTTSQNQVDTTTRTFENCRPPYDTAETRIMCLLWKPSSPPTGQIPVTTATNHTLHSTPRPDPANRDPPCLDQPILSHTENWLAAILRKHLQTAWDLVSQTRLWPKRRICFMRTMIMKETSHLDNRERKLAPQGNDTYPSRGANDILQKNSITSKVEISDRFVTQPGGVITTVKKFE